MLYKPNDHLIYMYSTYKWHRKCTSVRNACITYSACFYVATANAKGYTIYVQIDTSSYNVLSYLPKLRVSSL